MDKKSKLHCILLVDDDKATNFLNKRLLTKMNVAQTIQIAKNGVEADEYLNKSAQNHPDYPRPDLIFLDINMPLVNGWEFLERYENLPENFKRSVLIVMLTTSLREVDAEKARNAKSVSGFINKPLGEGELRKIINTYFP